MQKLRQHNGPGRELLASCVHSVIRKENNFLSEQDGCGGVKGSDRLRQVS